MSKESFYRWRPHPWHGLEVGPEPPRIVNVYVEITPFDTIKYEIDKVTGYLKVDRPQRSSSLPPVLYGFIPRTFCAERVAALSPKSKGGDGDPMDICVISERPIRRQEVILQAKVIGGIQMIDEGKSDDKIIAILQPDNLWGEMDDISMIPKIMLERIRHYFSTYKEQEKLSSRVSIEKTYDAKEAFAVVNASILDYQAHYGENFE